MSWYIGAWKKYATFGGRARRTEYWMFFLFNVLVSVVWAFAVGVVAGVTKEPAVVALVYLYSLAALLPGIAVGVRRMHDSGHSGWWLLVPIVNLVFALSDSERGPNEWGPNPKAAAAA